MEKIGQQPVALYNCNCNTQKALENQCDELLEVLKLTRNFVYAYSEEDVVAPGLLVKIDAAIAAAKG